MLTKFTSLSCLGCHVLDVLSSVQSSLTIQADLSTLTCHGCPVPVLLVPDIHSRPSCHGCHATVVPSQLSCSVRSLMFWQSWLFFHFLAVLSQLPCRGCPVPAVLHQHFVPSSSDSAVLSLQLYVSWPFCPLGSVQADLSRLTCWFTDWTSNDWTSNNPTSNDSTSNDWTSNDPTSNIPTSNDPTSKRTKLRTAKLKIGLNFENGLILF